MCVQPIRDGFDIGINVARPAALIGQPQEQDITSKRPGDAIDGADLECHGGYPFDFQRGPWATRPESAGITTAASPLKPSLRQHRTPKSGFAAPCRPSGAPFEWPGR